MEILKVLFLSTFCFVVVVCQNSKARIYGGYDINISEVPYTVFVLKKHDDGKYYDCGGVILDKRYVLTAGHCLTDTATGKLVSVTVRSGSNYMHQSGEIKSVEGYLVHPKYSKSETNDYDYGFVKLSSDLDFNANQSPAKLPGPDEEINTGHEFLIAGWGDTEPNVPNKWHLRAVKLPKFSKPECKKLYSELGELSSREMCVGFADPDANNKTTAGLGDSGSPVVSTTYNTVHGIVALRYGSRPTVISKIHNILEWITNVLSGHVKLKPLNVSN